MGSLLWFICAVKRGVMHGHFHGRVGMPKELQQMNAKYHLGGRRRGAPSWQQMSEAQSAPAVATKESPSSSRPVVHPSSCAWSEVRV